MGLENHCLFMETQGWSVLPRSFGETKGPLSQDYVGPVSPNYFEVTIGRLSQDYQEVSPQIQRIAFSLRYLFL